MYHVYKINGVEWVRLSGILSTHHRGCEGGDLCLYSPHSFISTTYDIDHFCSNPGVSKSRYFSISILTKNSQF